MTINIEKSIRIGIVIPTYNRAVTLKEAVESVLRQTHKDCEIIVLDDCSTDNTAAYLQTITDRRVRFVINQSNLGLAANINKGVSLLSEDVEWCIVLCDDDYLDEKCIEALVSTVLSRNADTVVHGHIVFHDYNSNALIEGRPSPAEESALQFIESRALFLKDRYLSCVMFSRKYFNSIGGYPPFASGLAADDALIFALALKDRLYCNAESIVYIGIHEGAESRQNTEISRHVMALRQYYHYCFHHAKVSRQMTTNELKILRNYLKIFVSATSIHFWNHSMRMHMANDACASRRMLRRLYRLGVDPRFHFSPRIRVSSFIGLVTGICVEKYDKYDKIVNKLTLLLSNKSSDCTIFTL